MAVAAAGREGSLEPAAGAGVWQGVQIRGPPCPAGPHLGGSMQTLAVPGRSGSCLSQNRGYCLCTGPGTTSVHPFILGPTWGVGLEEPGAEAPDKMEKWV